MSDGGTTSDVVDRSAPSDGPDPWCTWCHSEPPDGDLPYRIEGEDDGRWPPAFCSLECAARWGCAAHQGRIYHVEHDRGLRCDGGQPSDGVSRRQLLSAFCGAGTAVTAGCASTFNDEEVNCSGDCEAIEDISFDSHSGVGEYFDITVVFTEPFHGQIIAEGFQAEGSEDPERVVYREFTFDGVGGSTLELGKYASRVELEVVADDGREDTRADADGGASQ